MQGSLKNIVNISFSFWMHQLTNLDHFNIKINCYVISKLELFAALNKIYSDLFIYPCSKIIFICPTDLSVPTDGNEVVFSDDTSLSKKELVRKKWNQIKKVGSIFENYLKSANN